MKRRKKWIVTAVLLLIAGTALCCAALAALGFDFTRLSTVKYVTNTYEITESFHNIQVLLSTEDISLLPSEDDMCRVVCLEDEKALHQVRAEGDTLLISKNESRGWPAHFGFSLESPRITIYLPEKEYASFSVKASTGDVEMPADFTFETADISLSTGDISCLSQVRGSIDAVTDTGSISLAGLNPGKITLSSDTGRIRLTDAACTGDIDIKVSTGKVTLENVTCGNLRSDGSTGDMNLENVIASDEMRLERNTGNIRLEDCDAESLFLETDTGSVTGTLLTDKVFITETSTGSVSVPKTASGGRCEISTSTGDITFEIRKGSEN